MRVMLWALHFAEYAASLAVGLRRQGCTVTLVLYGDNARREIGDDFYELLRGQGIVLDALERPRSPADVLRNTASLRAIVKRDRPDVLHVQENHRDEIVLALLSLGRLPVVLTVHDPVPHFGLDAQRFRFHRARVYFHYLRRRADRAITHGEVLRQQLATLVPTLRDRIDAIPHGPLGVLRPAPRDQARPAPPRLLFFGRIHAYKGLRYFIEAVQRLHRSGLALKGIIAGQGPDLDSNRDLILQTPDAFELVEGYVSVSDVRRLCAEATAFVLPYVDGSQSGVAALALGFGRPVIATRVGSIPEFVKDGRNGVLIAPRDVDALALAIERILRDPAYWQHLSEGAASLRDDGLSWRAISKMAIDCYTATLNHTNVIDRRS